MSRFAKAIHKFFSDEDGPSAVEYGLMIALIAAIVIFGARTMGNETKDVFENIAEKLEDFIN